MPACSASASVSRAAQSLWTESTCSLFLHGLRFCVLVFEYRVRARARCFKDCRLRIWARRDWPNKQSLVFLWRQRTEMKYRCEATSVSGLIQQLAVGYVGRGYFFYVTGQIPQGKDPRLLDEKLTKRYAISASKATRARRKTLGLANVQYLRFKDRFVLLST